MKSRLFLAEIGLNPKIQRCKRQILMATDMNNNEAGNKINITNFNGNGHE